MVTTEEMKYLKICDSYLGNVEYWLTFKSTIKLVLYLSNEQAGENECFLS